MLYNRSTFIAGDSEPIVHLKCGNFRTAFLAFCMIFWLFSLVFLCEMAAHSGIPKFAERAHAINHYFGNSSAAFMAGPAIVLATLFYFAWGRKTLTWYNGVIIDDKPINVLHYQFKQMSNNVHLIYLRSAGRLYIVYPVTSEDGRKFPDVKIMKKEAALNEVQVELLKNKLKTSAATEKRFWFFTKDVVISLIVFLVIVAAAFLDI